MFRTDHVDLLIFEDCDRNWSGGRADIRRTFESHMTVSTYGYRSGCNRLVIARIRNRWGILRHGANGTKKYKGQCQTKNYRVKADYPT